MRNLALAGLFAILSVFLLLWLAPSRVRHSKLHAPAVIRFEPPAHASPPAKGRKLLPSKVV